MQPRRATATRIMAHYIMPSSRKLSNLLVFLLVHAKKPYTMGAHGNNSQVTSQGQVAK